MTMILSNSNSASDLDPLPTKPHASRGGGGGYNNIASPDKTVASTPPASPRPFEKDDEGGNSPTSNDDDGGADFEQQFDNNAFSTTTNTHQGQQHHDEHHHHNQGNNGGGGVSPDPLPSNIHKTIKNKKLLRVDKILCRVPSHESNISDLSASLSPNYSKVPGPLNNGGGGVGGMCGPDTTLGGTIPHGEADAAMANGMGDVFPPSTSKNTENDNNIVYSLLNECGVFENVNDLLGGGGDGEEVPPPPPPPGPPPSSGNGTPASSNKGSKKNGAEKGSGSGKVKKKGWGACYDKPAVWGVAPDNDDDSNTEPTNDNDFVTRSMEEQESVEYDNVELVLDETTLYPSFSARDSPDMKQMQRDSPALAQGDQGNSGSGKNRLRHISPPTIPGRKSPGILKNSSLAKKLSAVGNHALHARRTTTPSPATMASQSVVTDEVSAQSAVLGGVAVVESKHDPRISHMYDIAQFENEELRPSLGGGERGGSGTPVNVGGGGRGVSPAGVPSGSDLDGEMLCQPVAGEGVVSNEGGLPKLLPIGKSNKKQSSRQSASTFAGEADVIPNKVDLAMAAASGVHPTSEEVEVDSAPLFKSEDKQQEEKKTTKGGGKKLLKGISFKPKSVRSPKVVENKSLSKTEAKTDDKKSKAKPQKSKRGVKLLRPKSINKQANKSSAATNALSSDNTHANLTVPASTITTPTTTPATSPSNTQLDKETLAQAKKWKATLDKNTDKYYYYHRETKEVRWEKPAGFDEVHGIVATTNTTGTNEQKENDNVVAIIKGEETISKPVVAVESSSSTKKEKSKKGIVGLGGLGGLGKGKSSKVDKAAEKQADKESGAKAEKKADNAQSSKTESTNEAKGVKEAVKSKDDTTGAAPADTFNDAKYWRATLDASSGKTYYYNKKTKETTWIKPLVLQDASEKEAAAAGKESAMVKETEAMSSVAEKRKKTWFKKKGGDNKAAVVDEKAEKKSDKLASVEEEDNNPAAAFESKAVPKEESTKKKEENTVVDEYAKYWRATLDASTGKTYYFNKKTKLVTWTKPEGFKEKESGEKKKEKKAPIADMEDKAAAGIAAKEEAEAAESAAAAEQEPVVSSPAYANEHAAEPHLAEDESEIEGFTEEEALESIKAANQALQALDEDAPFDEPDAPFDEPASPTAPSPRRAHFEPHKPAGKAALSVSPMPQLIDEADDAEHQQELQQEQEDSFDESDLVVGGQPLYGRVKSLKSIDFDGSRQRTFASAQTETTRKAANTAASGGSKAHQGLSKDDSATFESSLNNSSIASEIFTEVRTTEDHHHQGGKAPGNHGDYDNSRRPPKQHQSEIRSGKKLGGHLLPNLPATPPRTSRNAASSRNRKNHQSANNNSRHRSRSGGRYAKQAENLGDSSIEEDSYEMMDEQADEYWSDDDVSELSGIGNESIEDRKKRRKRRQEKEQGRRELSRSQGEENRSRSRGDDRQRHHQDSRTQETSSSRQHSKDNAQHQSSGKSPPSGEVREWTQQELDAFISKNDWGSVAKYINEMRSSKGGGGSGRGTGSNNHEFDQIDVRKQPSIREIQERIEYNRRIESESSKPKTRFGARSQIQHDEISEEDSNNRSTGQESESVWQSLSSASYESEEESWQRREQQQQQQHHSGRQRSSSNRRRRSSPREMMM